MLAGQAINLGDAVVISITGMAIVMLELAILAVFIQVMSKILATIVKGKEEPGKAKAAAPTAAPAPAAPKTAPAPAPAIQPAAHGSGSGRDRAADGTGGVPVSCEGAVIPCRICGSARKGTGFPQRNPENKSRRNKKKTKIKGGGN